MFPLLKELGLIDKDKAWYTNDKVKPYYENESANFGGTFQNTPAEKIRNTKTRELYDLMVNWK